MRIRKFEKKVGLWSSLAILVLTFAKQPFLSIFMPVLVRTTWAIKKALGLQNPITEFRLFMFTDSGFQGFGVLQSRSPVSV